MTLIRVGHLQLHELRQRLGEREFAVIHQVGELRLMSGRQIEAIHFPVQEHASSETAARLCRRLLSRLVEERILVRLPRQVGGIRAGSRAFVYGLGPVGHRLLYDDGSRLRVYEPGELFVHHQLAVSQLVIDLTLAERRGELELLSVEGEPACWRKVPAVGRLTLRPDLFLALGVGEFEYRWFVELDRDTHRAPALLRKARLYESYYRSGIEQATHGVSPRVLWVTPDERRAARLRTLLESGDFTTGLMVVTTAEAALRVLAGGES